MSDNWIDCTGDACKGDVIRFTERVFAGSHRRPRYVGDREIVAKVTGDSYGAAKQQHTFSLLILESKGHSALAPGRRTTRKGRNIYRNGTERRPWDDEDARRFALDAKHRRGDFARAARETRREYAR
jgi:hypothetical protein